MDSPFEVLDVDPDADEAEIERAYRRRVVEAHPDQGGSARAFQRVRAAYEQAIAESSSVDRPDDGSDEAAPPEEPDAPRVEYLNYEVLDDHGWALDDDDLFEKAADADLDPVDHGRFLVEEGETLLEAAEGRGFAWPYACRGGACANCAVAVVEGELSTPGDHILPDELVAAGIRLSCVGAPTALETKVVYNVKHLAELDDLRLPPHPFSAARSDD